nr:hypothetical protein [Synergistaceae bacterium]
MNAEEFLEVCESVELKVKLNDDGVIAFTGEASLITAAQIRFKNFNGLEESVTAILRERAAQEQAQAKPQAQERQPQSEPHVYTYEEVTANYHKAYMESKRRLALDVNTSPYSPFFIDGVTDKVAGYKWTAELAKLRERQALQAKDI